MIEPLPRSLSALLAREGALLDDLEALCPEAKRISRELDGVSAAVDGALEDRILAVVGEVLGLCGGGAVWTKALPEIQERLTLAETLADPAEATP
jgi:hypothetical protein